MYEYMCVCDVFSTHATPFGECVGVGGHTESGLYMETKHQNSGLYGFHGNHFSYHEYCGMGL